MAKGLVECDKLIRGKPWPRKEDFTTINVCSCSPGIWKQLSPFYLGPIEYTETLPNEKKIKRVCLRFETLWQSAKVFPGEWDEEKKIPIAEWWKRRETLYNDPKAKRHIKKGVKPLFSYWNGKTYSYIEARKVLYIPYYVELATHTEAYTKLKKLHDDGENLLLIGFDGRPFKDLHKELYNEKCPFGHELVLCALLLDQRVWENGPNTHALTVDDFVKLKIKHLHFSGNILAHARDETLTVHHLNEIQKLYGCNFLDVTQFKYNEIEEYYRRLRDVLMVKLPIDMNSIYEIAHKERKYKKSQAVAIIMSKLLIPKDIAVTLLEYDKKPRLSALRAKAIVFHSFLHNQTQEEKPEQPKLMYGDKEVDNRNKSNVKDGPPGLYYYPNIITKVEPIHEFLEQYDGYFHITGEKSRKVAHFGYAYNYKSGTVQEKAPPFPMVIRKLAGLAQEIVKQGIYSSAPDFNQCIINRYLPGEGIGAHTDSEQYGEVIACYTFVSGGEMEFVTEKSTTGDGIFKVYTQPSSLYVMSGEARHKWKHMMRPRLNDEEGKRGVRYSITFRHVP